MSSECAEEKTFLVVILMSKDIGSTSNGVDYVQHKLMLDWNLK